MSGSPDAARPVMDSMWATISILSLIGLQFASIVSYLNGDWTEVESWRKLSDFAQRPYVVGACFVSATLLPIVFLRTYIEALENRAAVIKEGISGMMSPYDVIKLSSFVMIMKIPPQYTLIYSKLVETIPYAGILFVVMDSFMFTVVIGVVLILACSNRKAKCMKYAGIYSLMSMGKILEASSTVQKAMGNTLLPGHVVIVGNIGALLELSGFFLLTYTEYLEDTARTSELYRRRGFFVTGNIDSIMFFCIIYFYATKLFGDIFSRGAGREESNLFIRILLDILVYLSSLVMKSGRLLVQAVIFERKLGEKLNESQTLQTTASMEKIASQRSTDIISGIFPSQVHNDLYQKGCVEPKEYSTVTVFMSDIIGFTAIANQCTPIETYFYLDKVYRLMDYVLLFFPLLYKVETIGDGYMVCAGINCDGDPIRNAAALADYALLIGELICLVPVPSRPEEGTRLRIGMSTGDIVAGIVGSSMQRYCLFGSTVNLASRLESTGSSCAAHISKSTASLLQGVGCYTIQQGGEQSLKGFGGVTTYWLRGYADTSNVPVAELAIAARSGVEKLVRSFPEIAMIRSPPAHVSSGECMSSTLNALPNLLIVDDDSVSLKFLRRMLKGTFNIILAQNGQECIDIIQNSVVGCIDIILLDYFLGSSTGLELLSKLPGIFVGIVIGVSSDTESVCKMQASPLIAAAFYKPVGRDAIIEVWNLHLAKVNSTSSVSRAPSNEAHGISV